MFYVMALEEVKMVFQNIMFWKRQSRLIKKCRQIIIHPRIK